MKDQTILDRKKRDLEAVSAFEAVRLARIELGWFDVVRAARA